MRISLVEKDKDRKSRRRSSRRSRRRTYHSAIAQPPALDRRQTRPKKPSARQRLARAQAQGEQPEQRRTPIWKRIGWRSVGRRLPAIVALALLVTGIVYASTDASFFVYDAEIVGNQYISRESIYQQADLHEQHIFWVQPKTVAERVAQIPGIKSVRVRAQLPARVTITVEERKPFLMWRTLAYEQDSWLDDEGYVLPYGGDTQGPDTIFVVDSSMRALEVGHQIEPVEIVDWVRQLANALPGARVFYYQGDRGLNFSQELLGLDWPVYVGDGKNLARKIQAVQALNEYLTSNNIQATFVDVRWPDLPVYGKPAVATTEGTE